MEKYSSNRSGKHRNTAKPLCFHEFSLTKNFRNILRQIKVVNRQILQNHCSFTNFFHGIFPGFFFRQMKVVLTGKYRQTVVF